MICASSTTEIAQPPRSRTHLTPTVHSLVCVTQLDLSVYLFAAHLCRASLLQARMSSMQAQAESLQAHRNMMIDKLRAVKPFVLDNSLRETDVVPLRGHVLEVGADMVLTWLRHAQAEHAQQLPFKHDNFLVCCIMVYGTSYAYHDLQDVLTFPKVPLPLAWPALSTYLSDCIRLHRHPRPPCDESKRAAAAKCFDARCTLHTPHEGRVCIIQLIICTRASTAAAYHLQLYVLHVTSCPAA